MDNSNNSKKIAMHEKERKTRKRNCSPIVVSPTGPAAALLVCTTQRLQRKYGLSFFFLQRGSEKKIKCTPLQQVLSTSDMDAILQRSDGATSIHLPMFVRAAEEWSQRWNQSSAEQQTSPILPYLPNVILSLFSDMGLANVSEPFSLIGALTPSPPAFGISESTTIQNRSSASLSSLSSLSSLQTPQPLTSICINAIHEIVECTEDISHQAKMRCVRRRRLSESKYYTDERNEGSRESSTERKVTVSSVPQVRLFLLSPYARYDLLRKSVKQGTSKSDIPSFYGGEACEILLVYVCSKAAARVIGVGQVNETPEVWGRIPHPQQQQQQQQQGNIESGAAVSSINSTSSSLSSSSSSSYVSQPITGPTLPPKAAAAAAAATSISSPSPQLHTTIHEDMFFIAASVEDYLRLGSAFAWVYGWQLCYAPQGPPPRSLQWLKLFAPSALAAVVSETL